MTVDSLTSAPLGSSHRGSAPAAPDVATSPASPASAAPPISRAQFLNLFSAVMLPMFLASADQTLLATATPAIAHEFGALADTAWVAMGYLMASAVMIPLYGRLGDRFGYRRLLALALAVFSLGSALGGFAPSLGWLVAARVLQGLGGGGLMVLSQALIGELVPPRERPRFQGWFAAVFTMASVSGPVLGGVVVHWAGWRWLFWGLLPLTGIAVWRVLRLPQRAREEVAPRPADGWGVLGFALASVLTLLWVSFAGQRFAWASPTSLVLAGSALLAWVLLIGHERRQSAAFLPVELLRLPGVAATASVVVVMSAAMFALIFFTPIYLQLGQGSSAGHAGLQLLPLTLGMALGAVLTGRVMAHTGRVGVMPRYGLALAGVATLAMAVVPLAVPLHGTVLTGLMSAALVACGLGFGTVMPNSQVIVQTQAGRSRLGVAAALISLGRSAGANLGTAVFGAAVFNQLHAVAGSQQPVEQWLAQHPQGAAAFVTAFHWSFAALGLVLLGGAWLAQRMPVLPLNAELTPHGADDEPLP